VTQPSKQRPERGLRAIIFDAEGVVIDTEGVWDQAQSEFLARRGISYDRGKTKHLLTGRSGSEGIKVLVDMYGIEGDPQVLESERREIMTRSLAERVEFVEGFMSFFQRASQAYKTCLATSMDPDLLEIADDRLRLRDLFSDHVYTLNDVDFRAKPNPDLFLHASRQLEVEPAACAVIEDSPLGIQAAKSANMMAIGLASTYEHSLLLHADYVASSYAELELDSLETLSVRNQLS
jgi:HAD superfamily hydrolase (TIGR01509 family)